MVEPVWVAVRLWEPVSLAIRTGLGLGLGLALRLWEPVVRLNQEQVDHNRTGALGGTGLRDPAAVGVGVWVEERGRSEGVGVRRRRGRRM